MLHRARVASLLGVKHIVGIPAKHLPCGLQKNAFWCGQDALKREAGIVNPVLAAHKISTHQRTIYPRKHMVMHQVDLAENRAHLPNFRDESRWKCGERDIALFEV